MKKALFSLILLTAGVSLFAQQNVSAPQKFALVIGNSNYTGISGLRNAVNDANDMEAALKSLNFNVTKVLNGNLDQMESAVIAFQRRLASSRNTYGFFFYAGHGVQSSGENYLIPVDANNILSENHLRQRAVSLQTILDNLSDAGNELNMIVLDACRDNPFGWARSGSRGLSVVARAPTGSIVMYATGANSTASDGTGRNGLFTGHLLSNLKTQGLSVFDVFDKTMDDVITATGGKQHPELSLRFAGASRAYLGSRPAPQQAVTPAPQQTVTPQSTPTPTPQTTTAAQPQPTPAAQPQPAPVPAAIVMPAPLAEERPVKPEMICINGGTFTMGGNGNPQRQVTISAFYMGKYEVTQKEYQEVMGTNPSYFKGDNLPIENVSWFDVVEYCNKRSQKEGLTPAYTIKGSGNNRTVNWNKKANGYRLPTEAEWEYACRAETTTAYNTGTSINDYTGWYSANSGGKTHTVGQKSANAWGLHYMHGNVYEWCWDRYGNYPSRAQTDPTGAASGGYRVLRGGSWVSGGQYLRSAYRSNNFPYGRIIDFGFRVVRNAQ